MAGRAPQTAPGASGAPPLGTPPSGSPFTTVPGTDPFSRPPVTIKGLKPRPVRPPAHPVALGAGADLYSDAADPHAVPADLNASWRGLMDALGVGLPTGLNRAVAVSRRLHRAVA